MQTNEKQEKCSMHHRHLPMIKKNLLETENMTDTNFGKALKAKHGKTETP